MSTKLTGYVWDGCAASGMKLSSVAIMARLADFSNDEGVCWPSIETIARQIGAGMSTVRTAIARLEAEGWLTRKARRQGMLRQLAALSGVHRQTAAARLQNLPVAGGHESNLKLYRVVDIVSAFLALPPPVAEGEMDAHERKAWYQSERERLKFEQETAQLIPASDVRREFAIWAKAVVQVLETLPDILERDCGLQPAAVSRVQSIIDDLRDQIALRVTEAGADDEEELQQEE